MAQSPRVRRAFLLLAILAVASIAPSEPLPPSLVVTSVLPTSAPPQGGSYVTVNGYGFIDPVRVFFEFDDMELEAFVVSVAPTKIELLTPPVPFAAQQQMRMASVVVESHGSRVTARDAFLFESLIQRPRIVTATPNSGPKSGGTRVTIFGEGFQQPVQVLFGDQEARVLFVARDQILVESPASPDLRAVGITVRNINSGTEDTIANAFRYVPEPALFSVTPNHGRAGTRITILGEGFAAPVFVTVAGIAAQPLSVTGTKVVAVIPPNPTCGPRSGSVTVINVQDGAFASGIGFTYDVEPVEITAVNPRVAVAGKTIDVQLVREGDYRFTIGGVTAEIVARHGSTYRLRVPTTLPFRTGACTLRGTEGTGPVESRFHLHVLDLRGLCTATRPNALTIAPAAPVACTLPPLATVLPRTCSNRTVTIANERGRADLVITAPESVEPRTAVIRGGETQQFTLPPSAQLERLRFETNDPRHPWLLVCVSP